jgi:tRNA uridine 5-carbamoylmethylation protein Kti12
MPLLLMCGFPCSGKTTCARAIAQHLSASGVRVHIVNEGTPSSHIYFRKPLIFFAESLGVTRASSYADATVEKIARGQLKV